MVGMLLLDKRRPSDRLQQHPRGERSFLYVPEVAGVLIRDELDCQH